MKRPNPPAVPHLMSRRRALAGLAALCLPGLVPLASPAPVRAAGASGAGRARPLRAQRAPAAPPGQAASDRAAIDPATIDRFILDQMQRANLVGLAAGHAIAGKVSFARGYGLADLAQQRPVSSDTMFQIASVTKVVTATAVMRLIERGRCGLDEPVDAYLDFPVRNPAHPKMPITLRHLLMHTSSLSDAKYYEVDFRTRGADSDLSLRDFLRSYLVPGARYYDAHACYSAAAPGAAWDYCNVGFGLLGYLVERIGGASLSGQTRRQIFAPLGMSHTSWTIRDTPAPLRATPYEMIGGAWAPTELVGFPDAGAGMLRSSIRDFIEFIAATANGGVVDGARILQAATLREMFGMRTPANLPGWLTGQGLGWMASPLAGVPTLNHWGGDPGVFTAVYLDPATRAGVAIFTNTPATDESKLAIKSIASRLLRPDTGTAAATIPAQPLA